MRISHRKSASSATMMRFLPCSLTRVTPTSAWRKFSALSRARRVDRHTAADGHVLLRRAWMVDLLFAHAVRDRGGVLDHMIGLRAVHQHDDARAFPAADQSVPRRKDPAIARATRLTTASPPARSKIRCKAQTGRCRTATARCRSCRVCQREITLEHVLEVVAGARPVSRSSRTQFGRPRMPVSPVVRLPPSR